MWPYFKKMADLGNALKKGQLKRSEANLGNVREAEAGIAAVVEKVKNAGFPAEKINARGQLTLWQRLEYLLDPGTWCPLHTLYNPLHNVEESTNVFDGLGKISGKWAVIIGFDNKVMAGAWLSGQSENIVRVIHDELAVPLLEASGARLVRVRLHETRRNSFAYGELR